MVAQESDRQKPYTTEDYRVTERQVRSFLKDARQGPLLQSKLEDLDRDNPDGCFIEGFWQAGYDEWRGPLPLNINPGFVLDEDAERRDWVTRGASVIRAAAHYARLVQTGQLPASRLNAKDPKSAPLCSSQIPASVCSARIPTPGRDRFFVSESQPRHVVVISPKNRYYAIEVLDRMGRLATSSSVQAALADIVRRDGAEYHPHPHHHCGPLTAGDRDVWATIRSELLELDPAGNGLTLGLIDSAIVVVCLDDDQPTLADQLVVKALHGDGLENRWYDKNVQLIVSRNGQLSLNMEHTGYDGNTLLRLTEHLWHHRSLADSQEGVGSIEASAPQPLHFTLAPKHLTAIRQAQYAHLQLAHSCQSTALVTDFGKKYLVGHQVSPDAFVQLAYQLAFYTFKGRFGATYESLMMKHFRHGRTETLRPVTAQSTGFVRSLLAGHATLPLLLEASQAHGARAKQCQQGQGIDRHLYALKMLSAHQRQRVPDFETPPFFTDKGYGHLIRSELSTSNCGGVGIQWFGFGPVEAPGLGLGYCIFDDRIHVNATSWQNESKQFVQHLSNAFQQLHHFLSTSSSSK